MLPGLVCWFDSGNPNSVYVKDGVTYVRDQALGSDITMQVITRHPRQDA